MNGDPLWGQGPEYENDEDDLPCVLTSALAKEELEEIKKGALRPKLIAAYPDDNPKTKFGMQKTPLHLIPPPAKVELARAMECGAKKYGPFNWREKRVSCSIYKAAAERHLDAFWDGEDLDPESLAHHLGHAMACCAIVLDALANGMLNDDRPVSPQFNNLRSLDDLRLRDKGHNVDDCTTGAASKRRVEGATP